MAERSYNGRNLYTTQVDGLVTGDVAVTGSGGMESSNASGWYFIESGNSAAAEFDSSVKRTGNFTLKLSTLDITGKCSVFYGETTGFHINVKPNSTYKVRVYAKTNNVALNSAYIGITEYNSLGGSFLKNTNTNKLSGTNDWTLLEGTITTHPRANSLFLYTQNAVAGNVSDAWYDVNSIEVLEVLPARTPATSRTTATNRVAVRDMGTAIQSNSTSNSVKTSTLTPLSVTVLNPNGVTASAWFKYKTASGQTLLRFNNQADSLGCVRINIETGTRNLFVWAEDTSSVGSVVVKPSIPVSQDKWHHIAFSFQYVGTTGYVTIWLDGVNIGSGTKTAYDQRDSGNFKVAFTNSMGWFDDAKVHNRVLTDAEVRSLYLYGSFADNTALKLHWKFDEASGTTAYDTSGNGNDGTITGATYTLDVPLKLRDSV